MWRGLQSTNVVNFLKTIFKYFKFLKHVCGRPIQTFSLEFSFKKIKENIFLLIYNTSMYEILPDFISEEFYF